MRCSLRLFLFLPALACLLLGASFAASASSDDWRAVDPADLALKASTVEKDADAEALFWEIYLDDPAFFEHGLGPLFSSEQRKHEIYFHYPWSEEDEITIELPPGYLPENLDAPVSFAFNADSAYKARIEVTKDGRAIVYKRSFFFGQGGTILYPASSYRQIKDYFDAVQKHDSHAMVLMKGASS